MREAKLVPESVFGGLPLQSKNEILNDRAGNFIGEKNTKNMGKSTPTFFNVLVFHQEFLDKLGFAIFMPQQLNRTH